MDVSSSLHLDATDFGVGLLQRLLQLPTVTPPALQVGLLLVAAAHRGARSYLDELKGRHHILQLGRFRQASLARLVASAARTEGFGLALPPLNLCLVAWLTALHAFAPSLAGKRKPSTKSQEQDAERCRE